MRIISGRLKGRRFEMPSKTWKTRPTTDMARESLFNILEHKMDLDGIRVLDLFAGTGAMSYEFISRGVAQVTIVEKFGPCIQFIQNNLKSFGVEDLALLQKVDVFKFLSSVAEDSYDLVFADPPYALSKIATIPDLIFDRKVLKKGGYLILEHDQRTNLQNHANFVKMRKYGQSRFSFFE